MKRRTERAKAREERKANLTDKPAGISSYEAKRRKLYGMGGDDHAPQS